MGPWPVPLEWFISRPCPLCRQPLASSARLNRICSSCTAALLLPSGGLEGIHPLPWWAAGAYQGSYRRLLLSLRQRPRQDSLSALLQDMVPPNFPPNISPWLVPIPGWKRQANPLPALICRAGRQRWRWQSAHLLHRSRPVMGQHLLNRAMRLENQRGAFTCVRRATPKDTRQHPLLLVDDILTSGATALSAAETLAKAGWRVQGLICLARTPGRQVATPR